MHSLFQALFQLLVHCYSAAEDTSQAPRTPRADDLMPDACWGHRCAFASTVPARMLIASQNWPEHVAEPASCPFLATAGNDSKGIESNCAAGQPTLQGSAQIGAKLSAICIHCIPVQTPSYGLHTLVIQQCVCVCVCVCLCVCVSVYVCVCLCVSVSLCVSV